VTTLKFYAAIVALLYAAPPAYAASCAHSIARVQAQVDAAIEARAGSGAWKRESLSALRSYQPTPRSIAAAEAGSGPNFEYALDSLDRARDADRSGDVAACDQELAKARAVLRQRRPSIGTR
jgi:hypothetical protein